jgi:hypothetical protein
VAGSYSPTSNFIVSAILALKRGAGRQMTLGKNICDIRRSKIVLQMVVLLASTIGLLIGEEIRDVLYGEPIPQGAPVPDQERIPGSSVLKKGEKWKRYSGLFVLLKQKWSLSVEQLSAVLAAALDTFLNLVQPYVRSFV